MMYDKTKQFKKAMQLIPCRAMLPRYGCHRGKGFCMAIRRRNDEKDKQN
jgi:hypothetical protein